MQELLLDPVDGDKNSVLDSQYVDFIYVFHLS